MAKETLLTKNIKAKASFELLPWWDEDTKKQCKIIVNKAVMDNLITKLIVQDLIKINYKNQDDLIIAEAEIEVLERKPKDYVISKQPTDTAAEVEKNETVNL